MSLQKSSFGGFFPKGGGRRGGGMGGGGRGRSIFFARGAYKGRGGGGGGAVCKPFSNLVVLSRWGAGSHRGEKGGCCGRKPIATRGPSTHGEEYPPFPPTKVLMGGGGGQWGRLQIFFKIAPFLRGGGWPGACARETPPPFSPKKVLMGGGGLQNFFKTRNPQPQF